MLNYGYTGTSTMTMNLNKRNLADLSYDGILNYTVTATAGDMIFNNGTLTADVAPTPVPVPDTIFIFGSGLLCLWHLYGRRMTSRIS